jgi:hypothetical protein
MTRSRRHGLDGHGLSRGDIATIGVCYASREPNSQTESVFSDQEEGVL